MYIKRLSDDHFRVNAWGRVDVHHVRVVELGDVNVDCSLGSNSVGCLHNLV